MELSAVAAPWVAVDDVVTICSAGAPSPHPFNLSKTGFVIAIVIGVCVAVFFSWDA
jgi:hypothetical protein